MMGYMRSSLGDSVENSKSRAFSSHILVSTKREKILHVTRDLENHVSVTQVGAYS